MNTIIAGYLLLKIYKVPQKEKLLALSNFNSVGFDEINHIHKENLRGQFFFPEYPAGRSDSFLL